MLSKHFDSHHFDLGTEKICFLEKCRYSALCKCLPRSFSSKQATTQKYNVNPVTIFISSLDDNFVILAFLNPFCTVQKLLLSLVVYLSLDFVPYLCGVAFLEHCIIASISFKSCRISLESLAGLCFSLD